MNITLMAHDKKKELMVQFCTAYKSILSKHSLSATAATGRLVSEATGLPVTLFLSKSQGGHQQIDARIAYNEIDLVFMFSDPNDTDPWEDHAHAPPVRYVQRPLCDQSGLGRNADPRIAARRSGLAYDDEKQKIDPMTRNDAEAVPDPRLRREKAALLKGFCSEPGKDVRRACV